MAIYSSILHLENSMDREAWWATVLRVANSWIRLSMHAVVEWFRFHSEDGKMEV